MAKDANRMKDRNKLVKENVSLRGLYGKQMEHYEQVKAMLRIALTKNGPARFTSEELKEAAKLEGDFDLQAEKNGYVLVWLPKDAEQRGKLIEMMRSGAITVHRKRQGFLRRLWNTIKRAFKSKPAASQAAEETKTDGQGEGQEEAARTGA